MIRDEENTKHCYKCHHEFDKDEAVWMNRKAERICECCAMEEHGLRDGKPCCGYCGSAIDSDKLDSSVRDDDSNIFCSMVCALRYYGYVKVRV